MVRAFLRAESASDTSVQILGYIQQLILRLAVQDFQEISQHAEGPEQYIPRDACSSQFQTCIYSCKNGYPDPEFQCVGCCSERTDISAPETVDEESEEDDNGY